jgi:hypothetical protein
MPPVHVVPHILHAGGIPAIAGAIVAVFLSWPQQDASLTASSVLEPTKYHSALGGSGLGLEAAVGAMIVWVIVFALAGLAIGWVLVATGVVTKEEAGIGE